MAEERHGSVAADLPDPLRRPLDACARGALAPNVALMRLLIEARYADEIAPAILAASAAAGRPERERLAAMLALWRRSPGAWDTVRSVLGEADHTRRDAGLGSPARWAAVFDRLSELSPEAGVALYSLGSPDLLDAATTSLVDRLREWGLLGGDRTALDLGCGIGRVTAALAGEVGAVVGVDVSGGILAVARRRCAGRPNILLAQTSGRDLAALASGAFDLVLAVDTFPYLVLAGGGLAETCLREAHRVLRPGGSLVLFNYSYGDDGEPFGPQAESAGFRPVRLGTRDLAWWDGITYHVRRAD
ncbi:MAG: methyltransferase domain-containing protein [Hyphomicrobiaceae bacterium]|nr:methyltransferase domain-containing protein [Hyphomicrobiaceae bacterium]